MSIPNTFKDSVYLTEIFFFFFNQVVKFKADLVSSINVDLKRYSGKANCRYGRKYRPHTTNKVSTGSLVERTLHDCERTGVGMTTITDICAS